MPRTTLAVLTLAACAAASLSYAKDGPVKAVIDAGKTGHPISRYVYGQFVEHIGDIVNDGLWAEMLDDRKFYYPIVAKEPELKPGRFNRPPSRRWTAVGPMDAIRMNREHAYSGEQSPDIALDPDEARGIRQAGLSVKAGKRYSGRAVLSAERRGQVEISLVWGKGEDGRETIVKDLKPGEYRTYRFEFTPGAATTDARLEITGRGKGSLLIGAVSLMPADNLHGFRKEVIELLKSLDSGVYRFPGGNFVSAHEWRNAIGDRDKRPPIMDPVWDAVQPNDVGTDEFMTLCKLLDVEPYVTVNAGFGDAWSAAQLVEYVNGSTKTPMGRLRAANGHPEPYNVKFWGVGNEAWGSWQMGAMALDQFVIKHNQFARAMLEADPDIKLIGSGAMPDAMTCSGESGKRTGNIVTEYLGPADWTGGLITHCLDNMDMISEHFYTYADERFDIKSGKRVKLDPDEPLVDWMRRPANHVKVKAEAYADYLDLIPALRDKQIPIVLAEWAYAGVPRDSYKVVPAYAWVFHEMFRHSDLYYMANFTFATSLVSGNGTDAVLNPAGLLFRMYRRHFGTIPVRVSGNAPQSAPAYGPGGQDPKVNAGSATYPLDMAAALTEDKTALTVAVINPTESEQSLEISIEGINLEGGGTRWQMAPDDINAENTVDGQQQVTVEQADVKRFAGTHSFKPFSVSLFRLGIEK
ncbi:MAG TPA: alpha-N-arabinofuranosidase [Gammaproteobacteria bacterium]